MFNLGKDFKIGNRKLMSKNYHATSDVGVLESRVYLSTYLILALDGDDWSLAPSGQDVVIVK
jgi:hypothetical protein